MLKSGRKDHLPRDDCSSSRATDPGFVPGVWHDFHWEPLDPRLPWESGQTPCTKTQAGESTEQNRNQGNLQKGFEHAQVGPMPSLGHPTWKFGIDTLRRIWWRAVLFCSTMGLYKTCEIKEKCVYATFETANFDMQMFSSLMKAFDN
ncbi:hypothetical protein CKAN_01799500 [Cinnamomum micranthum f. kanehirae]|uniref:Uncharacterized protein n=1 Tax=Cinnamomum micranthum f. kanehirae TaxID=337451 RepID=A0A443PDV3_9MAGN|nr:hypothetical protein CKAN_01799500 [Cinnamomum micranthum f. kanehirae]